MDRIKGIFSTQGISKTGTGTTTRRTINKTYWTALELDGGLVEVQPLNKHYIPSGPKEQIPRDQFLERYAPEPEFYVSTVLPAMRDLDKTVRRGEAHRRQGETYSAEFEFGTALKVDEDNVRATFGLALTYLDRGDQSKAEDLFKRLVNLEAAFETRHKHLFNEFGISLRKGRMHAQAMEYYERALELTDDDENLLVNIARLHYERNDLRRCILHLKEALELNPRHDEAMQFWAFLKKKGQLDGNLAIMDLDKELQRLKADRARRRENSQEQRKRRAQSGDDVSVKVYKAD